MTICIEVSGPWQWKPGKFSSQVMNRYWWGCFAVAIIKVPFDVFCKTDYDWAILAGQEKFAEAMMAEHRSRGISEANFDCGTTVPGARIFVHNAIATSPIRRDGGRKVYFT